MKYSETKKELNAAFKNRLKPYGFKSYKYGFEKIDGNVYQRCGISVFDYADIQQAAFIFSIGIIPLAKIMISAVGKEYALKDIKPSHYPLSQAGLCDHKIFDSPDFTITKESDIDFMANTVMEFMENRGFKMLNEKSTIRGLEQYVNHECDAMHRNNALGLLLAKLLDKDYYHKLVYEYGEEVREWMEGEKKDSYYKTEAFLKAHRREELMEIGGITEEDLV